MSRSWSKLAPMARCSSGRPSLAVRKTWGVFLSRGQNPRSAARRFAPAGQLAVQPGPGESPAAVSRRNGETQGLGGLLHRQAGVVAELDQLPGGGVVLPQLFQGLVQGQQ